MTEPLPPPAEQAPVKVSTGVLRPPASTAPLDKQISDQQRVDPKTLIDEKLPAAIPDVGDRATVQILVEKDGVTDAGEFLEVVRSDPPQSHPKE